MLRKVTLALMVVGAIPATAHAGSLPSVSSGARPGPDLLYAPAPAAPQLENVAPWKAPPILVSGAEAYRDGEFLYQDFLFDDHGATGVEDPNDPFNQVENMFSPKHGTLSYPTDTATYANNAADLVELRVRPLRPSPLPNRDHIACPTTSSGWSCRSLLTASPSVLATPPPCAAVKKPKQSCARS